MSRYCSLDAVVEVIGARVVEEIDEGSSRL